MTYYGARQLAAAFRTVRGNTIAAAQDIGEEHYNFRPAPDSRTVRQTLAHIAVLPRFALQVHRVERRTQMEGLNFPALMGMLRAEEEKPRTKEQILALLREEGDGFAAWLETLDEAFLAETVTMMPGATPPVKSRFEMLLGVKEHEMHHRGQLMLMERMLGIVPHLTRQMQSRLAAMQASKTTA